MFLMEHVTIVKIYMVTFNVSILNRLQFFNEKVAKIVTILTNVFFPYLNPAGCLNFLHLSFIRNKLTLSETKKKYFIVKKNLP